MEGLRRITSFGRLLALLDAKQVARISEPHPFGVNGQHRVFLVTRDGDAYEARYARPYASWGGKGRSAAVRKRARWTCRIPLENPATFFVTEG